MAGRRQRGKERQEEEIKQERREDKWIEIKKSQTKTERKGQIFCWGTVLTTIQTLLIVDLN